MDGYLSTCFKFCDYMHLSSATFSEPYKKVLRELTCFIYISIIHLYEIISYNAIRIYDIFIDLLCVGYFL